MLMADQPFLLLLQVAERVQTEAAEAVNAARAAAKNAVAAQARAVAAEEQARTGKELAVRELFPPRCKITVASSRRRF